MGRAFAHSHLRCTAGDKTLHRCLYTVDALLCLVQSTASTKGTESVNAQPHTVRRFGSFSAAGGTRHYAHVGVFGAPVAAGTWRCGVAVATSGHCGEVFPHHGGGSSDYGIVGERASVFVAPARRTSACTALLCMRCDGVPTKQELQGFGSRAGHAGVICCFGCFYSFSLF